MTCPTNEELVMRFIREVVNQGDIGAIGDFVAADHVLHRMDGDLYGPEGVRLAVLEYRTGFPDLDVDVKGLTAEGNWVARTFVLRGTHTGPFLGIPGCGRHVVVPGIGIHRFVDGRLVESWISLDAIGMMQQMSTVASL